MSARDVIARTIQRDHDLFDEGAEWADRILSALAAAGYALLAYRDLLAAAAKEGEKL